MPPTDCTTVQEDNECIHYHVSSRHLMLASPWFERALTNEGWSESGRNEEDGRFHIMADDWDADALLIVLNAFHLRNRLMPRTVSLEMLAKIAVLVDYYDCGEAIELWPAMWIKNLKAHAAIPSSYCRDLVLWLWIAWTFDEAIQFQRASAVAIEQSTESLQSLGLPIPARISGKLPRQPIFDYGLTAFTAEIDSKRYQAIECVIEGVHSLLDKYRQSDYVCEVNTSQSFVCGSFLLGALLKELDAHALLMPRPEAPFTKLSFKGICGKVQTIQSPGWAVPTVNNYYGQNRHGCSLNTAVEPIVAKAKVAVVGLELDTMKKGPVAS